MHLITFVYICYISKLCASLQVCPSVDCSLVKCSPQIKCEHGFARDQCACCELCVRQSGERCGGENNKFGICDDGLYCSLSQNSSTGICLNTTCKSIKCNATASVACPNDSYKIVAVSEEDGCCQIESCVCLPDACQKRICPPGEVLERRFRGNGSAGACCDRWQCKPVTRHCIHDNRTFANGEKWEVDKCTNCACRNGILLCRTKTCNFGNCNQGNEEPNECCPRCEKGCITGNGVVYKNNDTWSEDECTTCECIAGRSHCMRPLCQLTNCFNPRRVKGECCPQCDDCNIRCKYGYKQTDSGEALCECRPTIEQKGCLSIETCRKQCLNGFQLSNATCSECHCSACPNNTEVEPICDKECRYGFKQDANGCRLCECISTTKVEDNINQSNDCINGIVHTDLQIDNRCRRCKCDNGQYICTECSNQTCNNLECDLSSNSSEPLCVQASKNDSKDTVSCLNCTCGNSNNPLCVLASCPAAACPAPVIAGAGCCPYCNTSFCTYHINTHNVRCYSCYLTAIGENRSCDWNGVIFADGQQWRKSSCESCVCRDGLYFCFQEKCSHSVSCKNLVTFKNRCCPMCLDFAMSGEKSCVHGNRSHKHGQSFEISECWHCLCYNEKQICENICETTDCFGGELCNRQSSDLVHLSTLFMILTIAVLVLAISISCIAKRSHRIGVSSISWPSTSTTHTSADRDHSRLNISYSKMDVCEKTQSIVDV